MQREGSGLRAWLVCDDILNRIKTELITQAMDTVKDAMDSKAIEVSGSLITLPDKPADTDLHMFLANKIVEQKENIISNYSGYLNNSGGSSTDMSPAKVERLERLKRFLLDVERISMLMDYSRILDEWMHDVAMHIKEDSPSDIIRSTVKGNPAREELLDYVLRNRTIMKEGILTEDERDMLGSCGI